jgi:hypothetical protein
VRRIDRIARVGEEVWIIDYKWSVDVARRPEYVVQLAGYRALVDALEPPPLGPVRCLRTVLVDAAAGHVAFDVDLGGPGALLDHGERVRHDLGLQEVVAVGVGERDGVDGAVREVERRGQHGVRPGRVVSGAGEEQHGRARRGRPDLGPHPDSRPDQAHARGSRR